MAKTPTLPPALQDVVRALARMAVAQEARETSEATVELADLRTALGLEEDFPGWKRTAEGLMRAFYKHVPHWSSMPLKDRLRLVAAATRELGRAASYKQIALRAGAMALSDAPARQTCSARKETRREGR